MPSRPLRPWVATQLDSMCFLIFRSANSLCGKSHPKEARAAVGGDDGGALKVPLGDDLEQCGGGFGGQL